jgi:hypothetical protein
METGKKVPNLKTRLLESLRRPGCLRAVLTGLAILIGYTAIYWPSSGSLAEAADGLKMEQKRLQLAKDIEHLRAEYGRFKHRLPVKSDANEWVHYVLEGLRGFPLKVVSLDPRPLQNVGPYKAVVMRIQLEGSFQELHKFLGWLETNERLFWVDRLTVMPGGQGLESPSMQLNVLGVTG